MPPRHRDSPLRHGAFRILLSDVSENAARLFVKKRVQQRDAAVNSGCTPVRTTPENPLSRQRANRPVQERLRFECCQRRDCWRRR